VSRSLNNKPIDIFCELPCLTEKSQSFNGIDLAKKWFRNADKRRISEYLLKFIDYNQIFLNFLGIYPLITGFDQNSAISFRTSNFIGAIPLRAPDTGKQIGDFIVTPKFSGNNRYSDYIKILNILDKKITYETLDSLPLMSGRIFHPPFYYEVCKYIDLVDELINSSWAKFNRIEKISRIPTGQINWNKYAVNDYKVEKRLLYPTAINLLNENHVEYGYIKYVFDLCKKEILSINTPINIKLSYLNKIQFINENLKSKTSISTSEIPIHFSDPLLVKKCKLQANKILKFNYQIGTAWRVDFSEVFERYIQYIFTKVSIENGGRLSPNYKISKKEQGGFSWSQKYLEPDAIYQKNNMVIMIDAKYKSHLYNKWEESEYLRQEHRIDLHQILCYSSFNIAPVKYSFLCYPAPKVEIHSIEYQNSSNKTSNIIMILGIPVNLDYFQEILHLLLKTISDIENEKTFFNENNS
jgi:hypothetical protein